MNESQSQAVSATRQVKLTEKERQRFWGKVNKNGTVPKHRPELGQCWEWTAALWGRGYGAFYFRGKQIKSHRLSYLSEVGKISGELPFVLHHCDNRTCVNPAHLFLGDHEANSHDMCSKGRHKTPRGDDHYSKKFPEKVAHGFQLPQTKLSDDDVLRIREQYKSGIKKQSEIADEFHVSRALVCIIVNMKCRTRSKQT